MEILEILGDFWQNFQVEVSIIVINKDLSIKLNKYSEASLL